MMSRQHASSSCAWILGVVHRPLQLHANGLSVFAPFLQSRAFLVTTIMPLFAARGCARRSPAGVCRNLKMR